MSLQDGRDMYRRQHQPPRDAATSATAEKVTSSQLAYGHTLYAAMNGDAQARELLQQADAAHAATEREAQ